MPHASFVLAACTIQSALYAVTITPHVWCRLRWLRGKIRVLPSTTRICLAVSNLIQDSDYAASLRYVALCRKVVTLRWADPSPLNAYQMWKRFILSAVN